MLIGLMLGLGAIACYSFGWSNGLPPTQGRVGGEVLRSRVEPEASRSGLADVSWVARRPQ
jgi:hypothetical protein